MRAQFWRWLGACFAFAAVPFLLKGLILWTYDKPTGFFLILDNGDLALAASILSSSSLLDLYLISRRSQTDKTGVFILVTVTSLIGMGYYGAVSQAVPGARSADDLQVTGVFVVVYLLAAVSSWFTLRISEEVRQHDRG